MNYVTNGLVVIAGAPVAGAMVGASVLLYEDDIKRGLKIRYEREALENGEHVCCRRYEL